MRPTMTIPALALALALALAGCPDDGGDGATDSTTVPDATADVAPDASVDAEDDADDTTEETGETDPVVAVSEQSSSLSRQGDLVVWAELEWTPDATCQSGEFCFGHGCRGFGEDGELVCKRLTGGRVWTWDATTGNKRDVTSHPGQFKDPVIAGARVIAAYREDSEADFDLWTIDVATGTAEPLVEQDGDDDQPSVDGDVLAWIGRVAPPHGAAETEVWLWDMAGEDGPQQLTTDVMEQSFPHVGGRRVVWTDYSNDPEGIYQPIADPASNNGDILGYDLDAEATFIVSDDPNKQIRPAIDGDHVVWMDWRGLSLPGNACINPEPKYCHFQIYGGKLDASLQVVAPLKLAESSWSQPELWQRPDVHDGIAAWIAEPMAGVTGATVIRTAPILAGGATKDVVTIDGTLESLTMDATSVVWLGGGKVGITPLEP